MPYNKKVSFHTLGCKLNFSETSTIARQFEEGGFERHTGKGSDICIINTCSVTENADKKCRNLIRKLVRENPGAIIAVTGCYAQLKPQDIAAIDGVDLVVGNNHKGDMYRLATELAGKKNADIHSCGTDELTNFFASFSSGDRTRTFLKVQDGCDYKCSYCTIPYARGASRNIPVSQIIEEAKSIAARGCKEIVLTGINTGDFGKTTNESFATLLRELDKVEGIERYRISSIEPNLLTDEVIEITTSSSKFQPHFHIPLQSGSDKILGLMRRRYTTQVFADRIAAVRRAMPDAFIGIDVIVGFPGETDEEFENTYEFLSGIAPAYLHVFPFSERPGTPATEFSGKVSPQKSSERAARLGHLCTKLHREFSERFIGSKAKVLFESTVKGGRMTGFTENYLKVSVLYDRSKVNQISDVKLLSLLDNGDVSALIV